MDVGLNLNSLPVRQKEESGLEQQQLALSADDGANLADDNGEIMETYSGSAT